jgi:hypothetical protein
MQRFNSAAFLSRRRPKALNSRGQELESLVESDSLRSRFFAWMGLSGRRYVCSVFQQGEEGFVADVESGVVVGVAREGAVARPVCVFAAQKGAARPTGLCICGAERRGGRSATAPLASAARP